MVKAQQKSKKKSTQAKARSPGLTKIRAGGHAGVDAYLRLLENPCTAPMVHPPFVGCGSGILMRTRNMITSGTNTDIALQLAPGYPAYGPITWRGVDATGTPINGAPINVNTAAQNNALLGQFRLVAACIKVHYTGSELNRAGSVYMGLHTAGYFNGLGFLGGRSATDYATSAQKICRFGSEPHELKYVPLSVDDQNFWGNQLASATNENNQGTTCVVVVHGAPAGTIMFEVDCVWECRVKADTNGGSGMPDVLEPAKAVSLNTILSAIGDVAAFATGPHGRAVIGAGRAILQGVATRPQTLSHRTRLIEY